MPEPRSPTMSPFVVPCLRTSSPLPSSPSVPVAECTCGPFPWPPLSPLQPTVEPRFSRALVQPVCTRSTLPSLPCPSLFCPYSILRPQIWSVLGVVLTIGPESDSALRRWRTQTPQGLPVTIHRTYMQIHNLQWPQLPSLRSLRDSGDIRPGWDLGPLLQYLRDDAGGPGPPSRPGHQAQGSPLDLGPSSHPS